MPTYLRNTFIDVTREKFFRDKSSLDGLSTHYCRTSGRDYLDAKS